ncbi:unnamed protein product [Coffea canephora]|uniref:Uncharacterized protein n=1 Tax=Coffea canephora TaxID=49390 RepID=A0A068UHY3_COFCA|nr:unnamed protein product [Coffea canephora]
MGSSQAAVSFRRSWFGYRRHRPQLLPLHCRRRAAGYPLRPVPFCYRSVKLEDTIGEGTHFLIPWLQKPFIFDIRTRPHTTPITICPIFIFIIRIFQASEPVIGAPISIKLQPWLP